MNNWTLPLVISHFDEFVNNIDFNNMPERYGDRYRNIIFQTANDCIFCEGRYSKTTEWTLEIFDIPEVQQLVCNLGAINALTDHERARLRFYLDLKDVCYPLFRGSKIDWTAWPWNMQKDDDRMANRQLFNFIYDCHFTHLSCIMSYNYMCQAINNKDFFSPVARNTIAQIHDYKVKLKWNSEVNDDEEKRISLTDSVKEALLDYRDVENHMLIGREMGFDILAQSVYDAMDTFIDNNYMFNQVCFAKDLAAWIHTNWDMDETEHDKDKIDQLRAVYDELCEKYLVSTPDDDYTWMILMEDVLGTPLPEDDDDVISDWEVDDDEWIDPDKM